MLVSGSRRGPRLEENWHSNPNLFCFPESNKPSNNNQIVPRSEHTRIPLSWIPPTRRVSEKKAAELDPLNGLPDALRSSSLVASSSASNDITWSQDAVNVKVQGE